MIQNNSKYKNKSENKKQIIRLREHPVFRIRKILVFKKSIYRIGFPHDAIRGNEMGPKIKKHRLQLENPSDQSGHESGDHDHACYREVALIRNAVCCVLFLIPNQARYQTVNDHEHRDSGDKGGTTTENHQRHDDHQC